MIQKLIAGIVLVGGFAGAALADHSFQDMLDADGRGNVFQAVHNLKKTKGADVVCDFKNSIQIPIPHAADTTSAWRQVVLCFENQAQLQAAHEHLATNPLMRYGVVSTYALPVHATMDIEYVMDEGKIAKIIGLSYR